MREPNERKPLEKEESTALPCELIQDIIPLYVEEEVNPKTKVLVEKHLAECYSCQDYVSDLKKEEPVLDHLPEGLPEPDTFKKWLKRFRIGAIAGLIVLILAAIGIGAVSYKAGTAADKENINTKDVVRVLKKAGLNLKASRSPVLVPGECVLGGVQPKVYDLDDEGYGQLYIYEFDSTLTRRKTIEELKNEDNPFLQKGSHRAYSAKNTVLVMTFNMTSNTNRDVTPDVTLENWERIYNKLEPITFTLGKTIFYDLNQGEKWVLYGEGKHWEAKTVVAAFEEKWTDEKGYKQSRYYINNTNLVRFKDDPEKITDVTYSFEYLNGMSNLSREGFRQGNFDEEQTNVYGGSPIFWGSFGFSQSYLADKNESGKFSVQWNGEEENFDLTLKEP